MKLLYTLLLCLLLTTGCSREKEISGETNSPEYVVTLFFLYLYEDNDLDKASELATAQLSRIMHSYGSAKQYTRAAINLSFDTVVVEVDRSSRNVRETYSDVARLNVIFSGMSNGEKVDDMRTVRLIQRKGKWFIEKVEADKFL